MSKKTNTTTRKGSTTRSSGRASTSKGNTSRSQRRTTSKGGSSHNDNFENDSYSSSPSKGGSSGSGEYSGGASDKGGSSYDDNYSGNSYNSGTGKGGSTESRGSNGGSSTKEGSTYDDNYSSGDSYDSGTGKGGSTESRESNGGSSTKGRSTYDDNYSSGDSYDSGTGKGGGYSEESDRGPSDKSGSSVDNNHSNGDSYDSNNSGAKGGYSNEEPINDPPYDGYDQVVAKQPQTDRSRNPHKGGDEEGETMVFTEEEVYGDTNSSSNGSNGNQSLNSIERVWVWAGGAVPRGAIRNSEASWWRNRVALGMTDYVVALNDHQFTSGLGIKSNYLNTDDRSNRWSPICEVLRITDSYEIAPHLMVFLPPNPNLIREAAHILMEIIDRSSVIPRSIQLDLEGWWTRRSPDQRRAGEQAIQQFFYDEWRGTRPPLGIGVTCIGSVPRTIHGALQKVDFAIPQMYASERNYGRPIRENGVSTHFNRGAEALGSGKKIIVGQTAYDRYVNPQVIQEMLEVVLRLEHPNTGKVREVAFWSDIHFLNSRVNREYFRRLTNQVKNGGLNLNNIGNI